MFLKSVHFIHARCQIHNDRHYRHDEKADVQQGLLHLVLNFFGRARVPLRRNLIDFVHVCVHARALPLSSLPLPLPCSPLLYFCMLASSRAHVAAHAQKTGISDFGALMAATVSATFTASVADIGPTAPDSTLGLSKSLH